LTHGYCCQQMEQQETGDCQSKALVIMEGRSQHQIGSAGNE